MGKILTEKSIKEVLSKVKQSSVFKLSSKEVCTYIAYRLIDIIGREYAIGFDELIYRLCEVGPRNLRFDPLTVLIFIESELCKELLEQNSIKISNGYFSSGTEYFTDHAEAIKRKVYEIVKAKACSKKCLILLKDNLKVIFKESNYAVKKNTINQNKYYLEFIVKSPKIKENIIFRFYNIAEWIYPDSWPIWDIFQEAYYNDHIPVLVAPRIHGACFPLFKSIGILARCRRPSKMSQFGQ